MGSGSQSEVQQLKLVKAILSYTHEDNRPLYISYVWKLVVSKKGKV